MLRSLERQTKSGGRGSIGLTALSKNEGTKIVEKETSFLSKIKRNSIKISFVVEG